MNLINLFFRNKKGESDMQYESIILELMTRIKNLENEVEKLKQELSLRNSNTNSFESPVQSSYSDTYPSDIPKTATPYTKTTDQMIDLCYTYGKKAFENRSINPWDLADKAAVETGMNRNSSFMYICAVKSMLEGTVYKRAINAKATRKYFTNILNEYGKAGLQRALHATKLHIDYRKTFNQPVDSIESICNEFHRNL